MHQVFVYGTLKEGFANFHINGGRRVPGTFVTIERYPMYIIGAQQVPWLVNEPGRGEHVRGELYEVDERVLADMDRLEQIDEEGWYRRVEIRLRGADDANAAPVAAFVYFGAAERLPHETIHAGPLAEFTAEHDARYRPDAG